MREYINTLESSYKQQLVSSTMLSEAGVSFLSKITSLLSSLKGVSLFVFKLLAEVAMETWRHKGKASIAAGMWFSGTLEPVYNFFKHIAHLSINWGGLWNDFQKLQLMSTKIAGYSIWTPGVVQTSWNEAWSIVSKHLATPPGGWTADSLKKILQGAGAQEQQIINAVYHLAVEWAVPMVFVFWFLKVVYTALIKSRGGKERIHIDKIMGHHAAEMQAMQDKVNNLELHHAAQMQAMQDKVNNLELHHAAQMQAMQAKVNNLEQILTQVIEREFPHLSNLIDLYTSGEKPALPKPEDPKALSAPQQTKDSLQENMRHLIDKVHV
jgi:hypothetical protein